MAKKQKVAEDHKVKSIQSDHWVIEYAEGFNSITRYSKSFHIPDAELLELMDLLEKWRTINLHRIGT